ncbi:Cys-tRNA(Pro) deacylase, prolyl-tRNA editing enzyme YbaK/EbsC [Pedococcus dokdonensis]|uniref:Cys-tRNA(Pro) deacylase, prolyl-tRNA editing enzyme YbaK/EbsC n=1 Tax=Pedococcus dokdonensis TaxID=443156 RepID=A0A1H0RCK8_9MICO|nr:YbaK/EbsC family protein [Pedococcus dokdonensis]SDP27120.1 Cys-tRNA(Pro) deacylase, prolyl-tRNA editing enzyme YbaK/EbsC [Pedococcus dokdonensis]
MSSAEGNLTWEPAAGHPDLLAAPVAAAIAGTPSARVAPIDADLADTAAFCAAYDVAMESSANCVVVAGKRGGDVRYAAVLVLASMRADVNGAIRRHLDVRKISFAPMDTAVSLTGMEYGGITPIGLPADWPILVDEAVVAAGDVVIGSGIRGSKVLVPAAELAALPSAEVLALAL